MGREERNRQNVISDARTTVAEHREILMGPLLEHDAFMTVDPEHGPDTFNCPKCRAHEKDDQICPGKIATLPSEVEQKCQLYGMHLHTSCKGCGFLFRRKCADWVDGDTYEEEPASPSGLVVP